MRAFLFLAILLVTPISFGKPQKIIEVKVAVLDNLQSQKFSSEQYEQDYFLGLDAAADEASLKGIKYIIKHFPYGQETSDFLDAVKKVKDWVPDLVIGPRSSGKLLVLKDQILDTVVLSPMATANAVSDLPKNFYSLTFPNNYMAQSMAVIANKLYPKRNIFELLEVDCKNCMDAASTFENKYRALNSKITFNKATYLNDQAEKINLKDLLKNYSPGDIFLLPNTSYTSGVMMARVSDFLQKDDLIFLGNDEWGSWKAGYAGKVKSKFHYIGIRVQPWSLDVKSQGLDRCKKSFVKKNQKPIPDVISYVSCHTLNFATDLLTHAKKISNPKETLLSEMKLKLSQNPNWFRPLKYAVHELTQDGEKFLTTVTVRMDKK